MSYPHKYSRDALTASGRMRVSKKGVRVFDEPILSFRATSLTLALCRAHREHGAAFSQCAWLGLQVRDEYACEQLTARVGLGTVGACCVQ